jgi:hypothetical protein
MIERTIFLGKKNNVVQVLQASGANGERCCHRSRCGAQGYTASPCASACAGPSRKLIGRSRGRSQSNRCVRRKICRTSGSRTRGAIDSRRAAGDGSNAASRSGDGQYFASIKACGYTRGSRQGQTARAGTRATSATPASKEIACQRSCHQSDRCVLRKGGRARGRAGDTRGAAAYSSASRRRHG